MFREGEKDFMKFSKMKSTNDNNEFQEFLEGGKIPENGKNDFSDVYRKLIEQSHKINLPDFDHFEKVKQNRKILQLKQVVSYAAIVVIVSGISILLSQYIPKRQQKPIERIQLAEAKKNTIYALGHFSKEWNACMAKFEDAKKMQEPANEIKSLKRIKIELNNPDKN